ncbi:hypothetical protein GCM10027162_33650 [Streptomyces incanus]
MGRTRPTDIVTRPVEPYEFEELGELTAQACLRDGLLDFGESDAYLGELRDVAGRAAAAEAPVAVEGTGACPGTSEAGGAGRVLDGVTFVPRGGPMADMAGPGEAEIRMLAVARTARRRGVGVSGRPSSAPVPTGHGPRRGAYGSCCRPGGRCVRPTASTSVSVSSAPPGGTGTPFRTWTTSRCPPMS